MLSFDGMAPFPFFSVGCNFLECFGIFRNFLELWPLWSVASSSLLPSLIRSSTHFSTAALCNTTQAKFIIRLFSDIGTEAPFLNSWSSITLEQKQQVLENRCLWINPVKLPPNPSLKSSGFASLPFQSMHLEFQLILRNWSTWEIWGYLAQNSELLKDIRASLVSQKRVFP